MPSRPFSFVTYMKVISWKKYFTYKDKQNHFRRSSVVYKLTCTCASNYIGQTRRNLLTRINEHKFDQRSEVCKHFFFWSIPSTVSTSSNRKYWEASSVRRNFTYLSLFRYSNTSQISTSTVHLSPYYFSTHNVVYDVMEYECLKIASLFFSFCFHLFLMMAYA